MGAGQRVITLAAVVTIILIVIFRRGSEHMDKAGQNLHLTVSSDDQGKADLNSVVSCLKDHCSFVNLKRFDEKGSMFEASFLVGLDDFENLEGLSADLKKISKTMKVSFIDY
jgi:hypothetical protein